MAVDRSRIEDAGEKLGGARKDGEHESSHVSTELDLLDQLWPKPEDWRELLESQEPQRVVAQMVLRGNLAKGPHPEGYFRRSRAFWEQAYVNGIAAMQQIIATSNCSSSSDLASAYSFKLLGKSARDFDSNDLLLTNAITKPNRRTLKSPFSFTAIERSRFNYLVKMGWATDTRVPDGFTHGAIRLKSTTTNLIYWKATQAKATGWHYLSGAEHETEALAVAEAFEATQLFLSQAPAKRSIVRKSKPWKWDRPEVESDLLRQSCRKENSTGKTTEDLINKFGIRGLEFGNWIPQSERQSIVDMFYDSLDDITHIFGLPDKFASLGGRLGFAFGSRGKGLSRAAAHFEPGQWIIHLTRRQGAGSLAHEFAHALDHFIAVRNWYSKTGQNTLSYASSWKLPGTEVPQAKKRDEPILEAVHAWRKHLKARYCRGDDRANVFAGAVRMDSLEGGQRMYWSSIEELFARCFEAYVHDKLSTTGERNEYLVYGVDQARHESRMKCGEPLIYPVGEERSELNQHMQRIIDSCRSAWLRV